MGTEVAQIDGRVEAIDARFERVQQQMDYRSDGVERNIGDLIDSTVKAPATSAMANVWQDNGCRCG